MSGPAGLGYHGEEPDFGGEDPKFARGDSGPRRLGETAKMLPIAFVVCNIVGLWTIYMWFHIWPLLRSVEGHDRAVIEACIFNALSVMLVVCYVLCIVTHPGTIPDKDPSWEYVPQDGKAGANEALLLEAKKSGDRRYCKWCTKYKPDRCHHCRVCRQCILKMDHHCPWIYNCVGFRNHKYFFLLLLYSAAACHFITWTMLETVLHSVDAITPFPTMFLLLFGETLAAFIGILVTIFFAFHIWLMFRAMTTIEFCEKTTKSGKSAGRSPYDRGVGGNIRAVLGENPLTWLLPMDPPVGNGLYFTPEGETARLFRDLEDDQGPPRRKSLRGEAGSEKRRPRESRRAGCCDAPPPQPPVAPTMPLRRDDAVANAYSDYGAYGGGGYGATADDFRPTKARSSPRQQRSACC